MPKEYINRDNKGDELLTLVKAGEELFIFICLLLCLQIVFKWVVEVEFFICVCNSGINNGVTLALTHMMYM